MLDLIMLSTPVLTGLFLGQSVYLYQMLGLPPTRMPGIQPEPALESFNPENAELYAQVQKESRHDLLEMAQRSLDAIPDVSCDAVAQAYGLPKMQVRRLSSPLRRKGKRVTEVGTYTKDQIWAAATECPF